MFVAEEDHLHALKPHHAVRLGPPAVVADTHADEPAEDPPHAEAQVANLEVALLEVLEGAPRLVRGVTGHMDLSIRADETAGLIDEDRRVVSVRGAGLVGELSVPEAEAKPQAPRLVEQRLRLRPRHLALEERVDLRLIVHPPAGKERRQRELGEHEEVAAARAGLVQVAHEALDDVAPRLVPGDRPELRRADRDDAHTWIFQSRVAPNCSTPCTFFRNAPGITNWPHGT